MVEFVEEDVSKSDWLDIGNYSWWLKLILVLIVLRLANIVYKWYQYRQSQRRIMRIKSEMAQFPLLTTPTTIYNKRKNGFQYNLVEIANDSIDEIRLFLVHIKDILLSYII